MKLCLSEKIAQYIKEKMNNLQITKLMYSVVYYIYEILFFLKLIN